jgi:hypothetical protein
MGEDAGMLDRRHFHLLAGKIREGSSAVRRWFAESNRSRRAIWLECGLVRDNTHLDKPNVFTVARRKDCALWKEGDRKQARLAWLLAPESAFIVATHYNTNMQNSTCNWRSACAAREVVSSEARLLALATIAALPQIQTWDKVVQYPKNLTSTVFVIDLAMCYNNVLVHRLLCNG